MINQDNRCSLRRLVPRALGCSKRLLAGENSGGVDVERMDEVGEVGIERDGEPFFVERLGGDERFVARFAADLMRRLIRRDRLVGVQARKMETTGGDGISALIAGDRRQQVLAVERQGECQAALPGWGRSYPARVRRPRQPVIRYFSK